MVQADRDDAVMVDTLAVDRAAALVRAAVRGALTGSDLTSTSGGWSTTSPPWKRPR